MGTQELNLNDYSAILKRRKWSLLLPALLIFVVAAAFALLLPSVFKSTSTILIEEQEIPPDYVMTTVTSYAEQRLQVINQRIMSTSRLLEIIDRFDLYANMRDRWTTEKIIAQMRKDCKLELINADIVDRRTGRPSTATIAFTLSYEGDSPQKTQAVANVIASLFLEENLKVRKKQVTETSLFFEQELEKIKQTLSKLNADLAAFKKKHVNELPELLQVNLQSLNNNELNIVRLNEQLRSLREKEDYLQTQLATVSPGMDRNQRLNQLKMELVSLQARYSESYPDVIKTKVEIEELEKQLEEIGADADGGQEQSPENPAYITMASQLASVRSEIKSVVSQIEDFESKAAMYRKRISATPDVERQYEAILRERENTQEKFNDLSGKLLEARVSEGLETEQKGERLTIIDPARLPEEPYKPNRVAILLIGFVLGVGCGIGCAALMEFNDQAVYRPNDLAVATSSPVLASIPVLVTPDDEAEANKKRAVWIITALVLIIAAFAAFHFLVMDLSVLWARIQRQLAF